jgi:hypothetical protein
MPQRPSKKPKAKPTTKADIVKGLAGSDQASQQRHQDKAARTILGKYQGRKSIDRG